MCVGEAHREPGVPADDPGGSSGVAGRSPGAVLAAAAAEECVLLANGHVCA
jgi:hypothetical protein